MTRQLSVPDVLVRRIHQRTLDLQATQAYNRLRRWARGLSVSRLLEAHISAIRSVRPSPQMVQMLRLRVPTRYPSGSYSPLGDLNMFLLRRWGIAVPHPNNPYRTRR